MIFSNQKFKKRFSLFLPGNNNPNILIPLSAFFFFITVSLAVTLAHSFDGPGLYKDGKKIVDFDSYSVQGQSRAASPNQATEDKKTKSRDHLHNVIQKSDPDKFKEQNDFITVVLECKALVETIRQKLSNGEDAAAEILTLIQKRKGLAQANKNILTTFAAMEGDIQDKGYPVEILTRHSDMIKRHKKNINILLGHIKNLKGERNRDRIIKGIDALSKYFLRNKFKEDPPLINSQPLAFNIEKKQAPLVDRETATSQIAGKPSAMAASRPPTQADLDPTIDVQFTQDIIDLAASLNNSPLQIYEYVRNNFQFEPYLGSRKGSQETLNQRAGSDYDLASLLIALLRVSNIPAIYATGIVEMPVSSAANWLGVVDGATAGSILTTAGMEGVNIIDGSEQVVAIQSRRVWVEAYIPYTNYRGIGNDSTGQMWVPLDPAFKQYNINAGIDVPMAMAFDAKAFVDNYITTFHPESPVELYQQQVINFINTNYPEMTYDDVLRTRSLQSENLGFIPGSLPYQLLTRDGEYSEIPVNKRYQVRFNIHGGGTTLDYTANMPEIAGKQVTISYIGATAADQLIISNSGGLYGVTQPWLVNLKPVLKIDGCDVATGTGQVTMGVSHNSDMHFTQPVGAGNQIPAIYNSIIAGTYQGIGLDTWKVVSDPFSQPSTACQEDYTGYMLHDTAMKYLGRVDTMDDEVNKTMHIVSLNDISDAIVEHVVKVTYSGSTPITFEWNGLSVDADRKISGPFSVDGVDEGCDYMRLTGADGSISENRIFEDNFSEEAISAVKILELASDMGIPVYEFIGGTPCSTIYSTLNQSSTVENSICSAVTGGHVVTVPRDEITYFDWTGTGYLDLDPATCAGGYIISGGRSGGATVKDWNFNPSAYCINATINSITPSVANDEYSSTDTSYLNFSTTIYPFDKDCNADSSYTKNFSTADPPFSMSVRQIANRFGPGVYTFSVGSFGGCGGCGLDQKQFTIFKVTSVTPECSNCSVGQTVNMTADYQPAGLNRSATWSIIGGAAGSTVQSTGNRSANFNAGNSVSTVEVQACDSNSPSNCATTDMFLEECKECQGGGVVNKPTGTLRNEIDFCCESGIKLQKNPITDLDQCPNRVDNPAAGKVPTDPPCSGPDWVGDNPMGDTNSSFESACDFHDICYGTCAAPAAFDDRSHKNDICDAGLEQQATAICDSAYPGIGNYPKRMKCHRWANYFWVAVRARGNQPYIDRQMEGCNCCGDNLI